MTFVQGGVPQKGRDEVHHDREVLLLPGAHHERGLRRRGRSGEGERVEDGVDTDGKKLGAELAVRRRPARPAAVVRGDQRAREDDHLLQCRPLELAIRSDI